MTIKISQETERQLRTYLAHKGVNDLSTFVEEAVQEQLYRLAVEEAQARGADVPEGELDALIDEAVRWARKSA